MSRTLQIDFVSDVSCPWCAIGLAALERALANLAGEVKATIHFQPFELNPGMPPGGEDIGEHLSRKYGSSDVQRAASREMLRQRGQDVGVDFRLEARSRIYNTFDAHRLLHWAGEEGAPEGEGGEPGQQRRLKKALFTAYFTDGRSPEARDVLLDAAAQAGLDLVRAAQVLDSDEYADAVRERETFYRDNDIHAVPATIIDGRALIPGGQPVEVFERILRKFAERET